MSESLVEVCAVLKAGDRGMAVGAMAQQDNEDPVELESSLSRAIQLRAPYIKGQADQLTLSSVRRLLERDLGLKNLYLEEHKAVIKSLVDKVLNEADNDGEDENAVLEKPKKRRRKISRVVEDSQDGEVDTPNDVDGNGNEKKKHVLIKVGDAEEENVTTQTNIEDDLDDQDNLSTQKVGDIDAEMPDREGDNIAEEPLATPDEELVETQGAGVPESPINLEREAPGKLRKTEEPSAKSKVDTLTKEQEPSSQDPQDPLRLLNTNESAIKLALSRRANDLKSRAESLTVTTVRHLLEEDLGVPRDGLKVHKQFIRTLVDELLAPTNDEPIGGVETEEEARVKKRGRPKIEESQLALVKKSGHSEEHDESDENLQGNGEVSDSVSEERRPNKVLKKRKKKDVEVTKAIARKDVEVTTKSMVMKKTTEVKRPFTAKVERLRDILKSVGIGVSPLVYKKAKQAREDEREDVLVKELENRLAQEGLSPNPTDKEMRKVKTRLEKRKDLDGIDRSNIVVEPRRSRAAANSWFAPRPNKYVETADEDSDDDDDDDDDDSKARVTVTMDDDSKVIVPGAIDDVSKAIVTGAMDNVSKATVTESTDDVSKAIVTGAMDD